MGGMHDPGTAQFLAAGKSSGPIAHHDRSVCGTTTHGNATVSAAELSAGSWACDGGCAATGQPPRRDSEQQRVYFEDGVILLARCC